MRIRKLEIHGFKSFSEKTVLHFESDITGIVGPNGCGKSNLVDAVRWCMGEQSAKTLRGDSMENVIFHGSESQGPLGMAEVAITFETASVDPSGGSTVGLPPEYAAYPEIVVARRLYRDGTSEYLINRVPVRLRDVVELFLGTGVGKAAYSIIEQGRVGQIVSARPEDLRGIIEEAAGVTKYRLKKKAAERRMEATRGNLARVSDVLAEMERNLGSLKRAAEKARRFAEYKSEQRDLELWDATFRYLALRAETRAAEAALADVTSMREALRTEVATLEATLDAARLRHEELRRQLGAAQTEHAELGHRLQMSESNAQQKRSESANLDRRASGALAQFAEVTGEASRAAEELAAAECEAAEIARRVLACGEAVARSEESALALRARLAEAQETLRTCHEAATRAAGEEARLGATIASNDAWRAGLREQASRMRDEEERLRRRTRDIEAEIFATERALDTLHSARLSIGEQRSGLKARLADLGDEVAAGESRIDTLRLELHRSRARLGSLEKIEQDGEGLRRGVRAVLDWSERSRPAQVGAEPGACGGGLGRGMAVRGLVADIVEPPPELETALAAALGERIESVIVDGHETGCKAIDYLKRGAQGRSTFIPLELRAARGGGAAMPTAGDGVRGSMLDLVRTKPEYQDVARSLLGDVVVVEDLDHAFALWRHAEVGASRRFVTLDGEVIEPDGVVSGGSREDGAGMLSRKREIRELGQIVMALEGSLGGEIERHVALRGEVAAATRQLEALDRDGQSGDLGIVSAEGDVKHLSVEKAAHDLRLGEIAFDLAANDEGLRRAAAEEQEARAGLEAAHQASSEAERRGSLIEAEARELAPRAEDAATRETTARIALATASAQRESSDRHLGMVRTRKEEHEARAHSLTRQAEEDRARAAELREDAAVIASTLAPMAERIGKLGDEVARAQAAHDASDERQRQLEVELRGRVSALVEATEQSSQLGVRVREGELKMTQLLQHVDDNFRADLRLVASDYHMRPLPQDKHLERARQLKKLLDGLMSSGVNHDAIREHEELGQRKDAMATQKADLEQALADLAEAITTTNRTCRKLLREALDAINERIQVVFPRLFRGGHAEIVAVGEGDILEAGVQIIAQPPGKKRGPIQALSGGEKALTAVSLLFAIFLYRPSPFCLLDEVDAPLDETNVGRFGEMLREMSRATQFILITHNHRTMEAADVLYGVTAEQPGVSKLISVSLTRSDAAA